MRKLWFYSTVNLADKLDVYIVYYNIIIWQEQELCSNTNQPTNLLVESGILVEVAEVSLVVGNLAHLHLRRGPCQQIFDQGSVWGEKPKEREKRNKWKGNNERKIKKNAKGIITFFWAWHLIISGFILQPEVFISCSFWLFGVFID